MDRILSGFFAFGKLNFKTFAISLNTGQLKARSRIYLNLNRLFCNLLPFSPKNKAGREFNQSRDLDTESELRRRVVRIIRHHADGVAPRAGPISHIKMSEDDSFVAGIIGGPFEFCGRAAAARAGVANDDRIFAAVFKSEFGFRTLLAELQFLANRRLLPFQLRNERLRYAKNSGSESQWKQETRYELRAGNHWE